MTIQLNFANNTYLIKLYYKFITDREHENIGLSIDIIDKHF